jgi:hypothetical protein
VCVGVEELVCEYERRYESLLCECANWCVYRCSSLSVNASESFVYWRSPSTSRFGPGTTVIAVILPRS